MQNTEEWKGAERSGVKGATYLQYFNSAFPWQYHAQGGLHKKQVKSINKIAAAATAKKGPVGNNIEAQSLS